MKQIKAILILSVTLFAFSNCDMLGLLSDRDTVDSLSYELTSSSMATDTDEILSLVKVKRHFKFLLARRLLCIFCLTIKIRSCKKLY